MTFKLPTQCLNVPWTCPTSMRHILEYLHVEAPEGEFGGSEKIVEFKLEFVRTAKINGSRFWLWQFMDDYFGVCFVSVRLDGRTALLGYDESFGLTPEQWLVMDYYDDWEN